MPTRRCRKSNGQFTKCRSGSRLAGLDSVRRTGRIDYVLEDWTHVNWPGVLPWRGLSTPKGKGYGTAEEAERRAAQITRHYNANYGQGGPDLRVRSRVAKAR